MLPTEQVGPLLLPLLVIGFPMCGGLSQRQGGVLLAGR